MTYTDDEIDRLDELEEFDARSKTWKGNLDKMTDKAIVRHELQRDRDSLMARGSEFSRVSRSDIIGIDNILTQIDEIIGWLRNPEYFTRWGARLEPGLLLEGAPGTGKTLCSRYIASSSDALFLNVRDWPTERETLSAVDVASLFGACREYYASTKRPIVIFWDEFEVFARERERPSMSMRDASVVSQITAELDGISGKCPGVLLVGCTNYKNIVDKALLRAGRMGTHIKFIAPDRVGKAKILKHYLSKFRCDTDLDFESGAFFFNEPDTAAFVEEAANKVWMRTVAESYKVHRTPLITQEIMNKVLLENLLGPPPPFMDLRPDSEFAIAVHELGHALVAHIVGVPIQVITIQPGRDTFGRVMTHQIDPKISNTQDVVKQITIGLGSIVAEEVVGLPVSTHASQDMKMATQLALGVVDSLGQLHNGEWPGPLALTGLVQRASYSGGAVSQDLVKSFDKRMGDIVFASYNGAVQILMGVGKDLIVELASKLLTDKTWTGNQFLSVLEVLSDERSRSNNPQTSEGSDDNIIRPPIEIWHPRD